MDVVPVTAASPAAHLRGWHRLGRQLWQEELPDLDPPAEREALADLESDGVMRRMALLAMDGDVEFGAAWAELPLLEDRDLAWVSVLVDPAHRRRGVGRRLLDALADAVRPDGRHRLLADALVGGPGEAFATAVGARVTQVDVASVLDLSAAHGTPGGRDDLRALAEPADGYRIVRWRDRCPDELAAPFAVARTAMNDAPQGDERHEDLQWSADRVREVEARRRRWQVQAWTAAAVETATGEVAGFTELLDPGRPSTALQEDTAVLARHRGSRLGLAVKAANLLALLDDAPHLTRVVTWNAEDNRHMRAVNTRLGFRPVGRWLDVSVKV